MKKNIEEMKQENGHFEINGREYVLTEQASFKSDPKQGAYGCEMMDNYYSARAICPADGTDEDGFQKCYVIRWEILPTYDPETDSEDCACDWDEPESIKESGEYSLETGRHY